MRKLVVIAAFPLLLAACAAPHPPAAEANVVPMPYVRVVNTGSNLVELQIALRKFVPTRASTAAVWLVGVAHIGDPEYYRKLQTRLSVPSLVLCEGVRPELFETPPAPATNVSAVGLGSALPADEPSLGSMQHSTAESLGLVFQLDVMNYHRRNFRNSDLSITEIRQLLAEPSGGPSAAQGQFASLVSLMQGGTIINSLIDTTVKFIGSNDKLRDTARLALIEVLGQLPGDFSRSPGLPPDVQRLLRIIIESRNQKVIGDLRIVLQRIPSYGTVAIFYGTGHMDDMERRLRTELHYRPAGEEWLTAFAVDLAQSGITPAEAEAIRLFAQKQMERFRPREDSDVKK